MLENLEEYLDQECGCFEGQSGVRSLTNLVGVLGYTDIEDFLCDNSGAMEAMINWIGSRADIDWSHKIGLELE
jgi:hypothetical protein